MFEPPPHLVLELDEEVTAPTRARQALTGLIGVAAGTNLAAALLMTSELVANVVQLGHTSRMSAWQVPEQHAVRVEIFDRAKEVPTLPRRKDPHPHGASGRGLRIVDALATHRGVTLEEHGKSMWFELGA